MTTARDSILGTIRAALTDVPATEPARWTGPGRPVRPTPTAATRR